MILSSHIAIIYPLLYLNKLLKQGKDLNVHRRFGVKYNFKKSCKRMKNTRFSKRKYFVV